MWAIKNAYLFKTEVENVEHDVVICHVFNREKQREKFERALPFRKPLHVYVWYTTLQFELVQYF